MRAPRLSSSSAWALDNSAKSGEVSSLLFLPFPSSLLISCPHDRYRFVEQIMGDSALLENPRTCASCGILCVLFSLHDRSTFLCVLRNLCLLPVLGRPCRVNSPSFPLPCSIQSYRCTCSTHASSRCSVCNILCYEPRAANVRAKNRHACSLCDWRRAR